MLSKLTILRKNLWPAGDNKIILTFDDGPNPDKEISHQLLDVLYRSEVKSTFCYIGRNIERCPDVIKRAVSEGHLIAHHTFSHTPIALLSTKVLKREIELATLAIQRITGDKQYQPALFRSPWGIVTTPVTKVIKQNNLGVAYLTFFVNEAWSGPNSYKTKLQNIKNTLIRSKGGAIVLHENCHNNFFDAIKVDKTWLPQAVEDLIVWSKKNGLTFTNYKQ